jgi:hypothetical protein
VSGLAAGRVFVDPDAELALSPGEANELRTTVADAGTPVYVAIVPDASAPKGQTSTRFSRPSWSRATNPERMH